MSDSRSCLEEIMIGHEKLKKIDESKEKLDNESDKLNEHISSLEDKVSFLDIVEYLKLYKGIHPKVEVEYNREELYIGMTFLKEEDL